MIARVVSIFFAVDALSRAARAAGSSHIENLRAIRVVASHEALPRSVIWISVALAALAFLQIGGGVAEAAVQLWGDADQDFARRAIDAIFPKSGATILTTAVGVLSAALSLFVVGVLGGQALQLVLGASERGEIEWKTAGIVRFAIFASLLVPNPSSGMSGGHYLAREVLIWSSDLASEIAVTGTETVLAAQHGQSSTAAGLGVAENLGGIALTRQILESETCGILVAWRAEQAVEHGGGHTGGGADLGANPPLPHSPLAPAAGQLTPSGEDRFWRWGRFGSCGALALREPSPEMDWEDRYRKSRVSAVSALVESIRESGVPERIARLQFTGVVADWDDEFLITLAPFARAYDQKIGEAASVLLARTDDGEGDEIVAALKNQGWPALGAIYFSISSMSARALDLAAQAPERFNPDPIRLERDAPHYAGLANLIERSWRRQAAGPELTTENVSASANSDASIFARIVSPLTSAVTNALISFVKADARDPLADLIGFGHMLTGAAEIAIAAGAAVGAASTLVVGAVIWVAAFAAPIVWLIYAVGWIHAYLLPMLPFVAVVFAYVSFLFSLIELHVAIPIFLFLGARVDGPEFLHTVLKPGLALLANAILRPIFIVIGFFAVLIIVKFPFWLVDGLFSVGWAGAQAGYTVSIGGIIGSIVILSWLHWQIAIRALAGINEIPDRILAYWGSSAADGASEARNVGVAAGVLVGGGNQLGRRVPRGAGGGDKGGDGGGSGGGELPGIGPVEASGSVHPSPSSAAGGNNGGGSTPWFRAGGDLSPAQQASAQKSYAKYAAENPEGAAKLGGFEGYVTHAQMKEAARQTRNV